jgi:hypothetical protein
MTVGVLEADTVTLSAAKEPLSQGWYEQSQLGDPTVMSKSTVTVV